VLNKGLSHITKSVRLCHCLRNVNYYFKIMFNGV
jgi:hypothetical protein